MHGDRARRVAGVLLLGAVACAGCGSTVRTAGTADASGLGHADTAISGRSSSDATANGATTAGVPQGSETGTVPRPGRGAISGGPRLMPSDRAHGTAARAEGGVPLVGRGYDAK